MNPDLLLIFGFVLTIMLVVLPFAYAVNKRADQHKERKLELQARIEEAKAGQTATDNRDYRRLEERVRVLERIATDGNHALASQIDELRLLDRANGEVDKEVAR